LQRTTSQALLEQLADQHRRVVSEWRALILFRRATFDLAPSERRWSQLPREPSDLYPFFRQMQRRGELAPIRGHDRLYEVTVPYARGGHVEEDEVLMEVHPYAALSHLSALVFHGLTDELPKGIIMTVSLDGRGDLLPIGTEPRDWEGLPLVRGQMPARILNRPVTWRQVKPERFFGLGVNAPRGYPVRVTTPERTLLDALQAPELSGGMENVLRAWALARDTLDLDVLIHFVDRFDIALLRQRAGFILEELGLSHPRMGEWQGMARRGGSSKLLASAPYAPHYSERWNLSLNAPIAALHDGVS
jgi:predicted transcriptional regulator of viral defense system